MTAERFHDASHEPLPERPDSYWVENKRLQKGGAAQIDYERFMADKKFAKRKTGVDGPIVAGIRAGEQAFLIFDTRQSERYDAPFLLASEHFRYRKKFGYKGIWPDETLEVGRAHLQDRLPSDAHMSSHHFRVHYDSRDQSLVVTDTKSMNGTFVSGFIVPTEAAGKHAQFDNRKIAAEFTARAQEEFARRQQYGAGDEEAPYGYLWNHPLIGRDSTTVADGIYGTRSSELVVVDHKSDALRRVTNGFMGRLTDRLEDSATITAESIPLAIRDYVREVLYYDKVAVERLSEPHYDGKGMIGLSEYVEAGVGVCRHQALLSALLAESAIRGGYLRGVVGVERNHDLEVRGAHAWAVLRNGSDREKDIIIDPAQNYVGQRRAAAQDPRRWQYYLPEDDQPAR